MRAFSVCPDEIGMSLGIEKNWYISDTSPELQRLFDDLYAAEQTQPAGYFKIKALEPLYHAERLRPPRSGKSTVAKLIVRFWDVQKGKITIGGRERKSMEPESLLSYMAFVFQDVTLFNDTVMNNIRLGNPGAADDQVIAAAKAAYCDEFIQAMPDGYQTV